MVAIEGHAASATNPAQEIAGHKSSARFAPQRSVSQPAAGLKTTRLAEDAIVIHAAIFGVNPRSRKAKTLAKTGNWPMRGAKRQQSPATLRKALSDQRADHIARL